MPVSRYTNILTDLDTNDYLLSQASHLDAVPNHSNNGMNKSNNIPHQQTSNRRLSVYKTRHSLFPDGFNPPGTPRRVEEPRQANLYSRQSNSEMNGNKRRKSIVSASELVQQSVNTNRMGLLNTGKASLSSVQQTPSTNRNSNINSRFSMNVPSSSSSRYSTGGGNNNNNGNQISSSARHQSIITPRPNSIVLPKDPRPLRDRNFQIHMQEKLYSYLENTRFESEMHYSLSLKMLKNPTQREFNLIFQFLYKSIDPGYIFLKSVDQEIYQLLKMIEYPYLETINKSQISAVGGSNWHIFLGMLYWLLSLVMALSYMDDILSDESAIMPLQDIKDLEQNTVNIQTDDDIEELVDRLTISEGRRPDNFFTQLVNTSYKDFLARKPTPFEAALEATNSQVDNICRDLSDKISRATENAEQLRQKLNDVSLDQSEYNEQLTKYNILKKDVEVLSKFIKSQESRKTTWPSKLQSIDDEINKGKERISALESELAKDTERLESMGYSIEAIDKLNEDRNRISNEIDIVTSRIENKLEYDLIEKQNKLTELFLDLNELANRYNSSIDNLMDSHLYNKLASLKYNSEASFSYESNYKVTFNYENMNQLLGQQSDQIIKELSNDDIKNNLIKLQIDIIAPFLAEVQENFSKLVEEVESITETKNNLDDSYREKANVLDSIITNSKDAYEVFVNEDSEIERRQKNVEKEIKLIYVKNRENLLTANQAYQQKLEDSNNFKRDLERKRALLIQTHLDILNDIAGFKLSNQETIQNAITSLSTSLGKLKVSIKDRKE